MLKTLKWVYEIGQLHERSRIKRLATEFIQASQYHREQYDIQRMTRPNFPFADDDKQDVKDHKIARMQAREHQIEIDTAVTKVLQTLIYGDPNQVRELMPPAAPIDQDELRV